jgi:hypothetical protein
VLAFSAVLGRIGGEVQSGLKEAAMQRRQAWAHLWGIVLVLLLGSGLRMVGLEQSPPAWPLRSLKQL